MKRKLFFTLLAAALLAAACSPAAAPAVSTQAPAATPPLDASTPAPAEPTSAPAANPASGDDIRVYAIVPEQTTARYEVDEVFFSENNRLNTAIGVTNVVSGDVLLNFTDPQKSNLGEITVDISTLTSDSSRRDNAIRGRWLESSRFPIVRFVPTSVEGLPADYSMGSEIKFRVTGDMTVREVTAPVTFDVTARLDGDTLTGSAETQILMTDFGFDPPDIAGMLKANNEARLVLEFTAVRQQ